MKCPWPESAFPMTDAEYAAAVPDEAARTAISGFLMRKGWEAAVEASSRSVPPDPIELSRQLRLVAARVVHFNSWDAGVIDDIADELDQIQQVEASSRPVPQDLIRAFLQGISNRCSVLDGEVYKLDTEVESNAAEYLVELLNLELMYRLNQTQQGGPASSRSVPPDLAESLLDLCRLAFPSSPKTAGQVCRCLVIRIRDEIQQGLGDEPGGLTNPQILHEIQNRTANMGVDSPEFVAMIELYDLVKERSNPETPHTPAADAGGSGEAVAVEEVEDLYCADCETRMEMGYTAAVKPGVAVAAARCPLCEEVVVLGEETRAGFFGESSDEGAGDPPAERALTSKRGVGAVRAQRQLDRLCKCQKTPPRFLYGTHGICSCGRAYDRAGKRLPSKDWP